MEGRIACGGGYYLLYHTMMKNADEVYFLADHDKIRTPGQRVFRFDELDYVVVDFPIDDSVKEQFDKTKFVEVE